MSDSERRSSLREQAELQRRRQGSGRLGQSTLSPHTPPSLRQDAELQRLLRGLGGLGQLPRAPADELSREERMAARIDEQVAELTARRRTSRRFGAVLMVAAVIALWLGGSRFMRWGQGTLTIEQEPMAVKTAPSIAPPIHVPAPAEPAVVAPRVVGPSRSSAASVSASPAPSPSADAAQSTLAQENQLFKDAAEASRTGDVEGALLRLDRLLTEHPVSPLAQGALVRKFRILASAGRAEEARLHAERYLTTYPTGFAVAEAEALKDAEGAPQNPAPVESKTP